MAFVSSPPLSSFSKSDFAAKLHGRRRYGRPVFRGLGGAFGFIAHAPSGSRGRGPLSSLCSVESFPGIRTVPRDNPRRFGREGIYDLCHVSLGWSVGLPRLRYLFSSPVNFIRVHRSFPRIVLAVIRELGRPWRGWGEWMTR